MAIWKTAPSSISGAYEFNDALSAFAAVGTHRYRYEGYINGTRAAVINVTAIIGALLFISAAARTPYPLKRDCAPDFSRAGGPSSRA